MNTSQHTDRFALPTIIAPAPTSWVQVSVLAFWGVEQGIYPINDICIALGFGTSKSQTACSGAHVELRQSRNIVLYTQIRQWPEEIMRRAAPTLISIGIP